MPKKQATKVKEPLATRLGRSIARRGPGTAKKAGRATKFLAEQSKVFATQFKEGFGQGWDDA